MIAGFAIVSLGCLLVVLIAELIAFLQFNGTTFDYLRPWHRDRLLQRMSYSSDMGYLAARISRVGWIAVGVLVFAITVVGFLDSWGMMAGGMQSP